jgi:hypothetical protein
MPITTLSMHDYYLELAKGNIPRHSAISKFGEKPVIVSGFETIWDGLGVYVPPSQARFHNIASDLDVDAGDLISGGTATGGSVTSLIDSAGTFQTDNVAIEDIILNDEKVELGEVSAVVSETEIQISRSMRDPESGLDGEGHEDGDAYRIVRDRSTGVSVLLVIGLSPFFLEQTEFVLLDGLLDVVTTKSYARQYRGRVFASAAANAVGTITSTTIGEAVETISLQVIDGNNQTLMAVYTIPGDLMGLVTRWWGSMSKKQSATSTVKLRVGQLNHIGYIEQLRSIQSTGDSSFDHDFKIATLLPGGSDIWMEADADAASVGVAGGFDVVLYKAPPVRGPA